MSKLMALVVFSALTSLAVIAARSTDVSSRLERALNANNTSARPSVGVEGYVVAPAADPLYYEFQGDRPHGCHSDSYNPADD